MTRLRKAKLSLRALSRYERQIFNELDREYGVSVSMIAAWAFFRLKAIRAEAKRKRESKP